MLINKNLSSIKEIISQSIFSTLGNTKAEQIAYITSKKLEELNFKMFFVLQIAVIIQPMSLNTCNMPTYCTYTEIIFIQLYFCYVTMFINHCSAKSRFKVEKAVKLFCCLQCIHNIRHFCDVIKKLPSLTELQIVCRNVYLW